MRIVAVLFIFLCCIGWLPALDIPDKFLDALNDKSKVGDRGRAHGALQLWPVYIKEVNRILELGGSSVRFTDRDRTDNRRARLAVRIYLSHWGARYEKDTGKEATPHVLARIHIGHTFWKRARSPRNAAYFRRLEEYGNRVQNIMASD